MAKSEFEHELEQLINKHSIRLPDTGFRAG